MEKRGLSGVLISLIIIFISLLALTILGVTIKNILDRESKEINLDGFDYKVESPVQGVNRYFNKTIVNKNEIVEVSLKVTVFEKGASYVIEEYIPTQWTVLTKGGGNNAGNPNTLKWVVFSNATSKDYTYTVKAPEISGNYGFGGIYRFTSDMYKRNISGVKEISVN